MGRSARRTTAVAVFGAALLAVWLGVPGLSSAQSAVSVSVELSPGRAVPANTAIDVTVSLSDLGADGSVTFRADVRRYGVDRDECEGSGIGADTQHTVDDGGLVVSATISAQCPVGGPYVLKTSLGAARGHAVRSRGPAGVDQHDVRGVEISGRRRDARSAARAQARRVA